MRLLYGRSQSSCLPASGAGAGAGRARTCVALLCFAARSILVVNRAGLPVYTAAVSVSAETFQEQTQPVFFPSK